VCHHFDVLLKMNWKRAIRIVCKWLLLTFSLVALLILVAFFPGQFEGNYREFASSYSSDTDTFMNFRDNRMVSYHVPNPPAFLSGRYKREKDGSVSVYLTHMREDEGEKLFMRAYPHLLFTKFVAVDGGKIWMCPKWPTFGDSSKAMRDYEIVSHHLGSDGVLRRQVFNNRFQLIRREIKTGPNQFAEQAVSSDGDKPSN
jgi:hypothetical protein